MKEVNAVDSPAPLKNAGLASIAIGLTPAWANLTPQQVHVEVLTGGLSNKLYRCDSLEDRVEPQTLVLREFCPSRGIIDRAYEEKVFEFLSRVGFGPSVYGFTDLFRTEEFFHSRSLTVEELSQSSNVNVVFSLLAHMHGLTPPVHLLGEPRPAIFPYIDRLVDSALKSKSASEDLKKRIVNAKLIFDQKVIPALLALNSPVVFAHNDAQEGNVLKMSDGTLMLIDYEYASYSYRGYDLANTLCEMSLDNAAPTETGFQLRPDLVPTAAVQRKMAAAYLNAQKKCGPQTTSVDALDALVLEMDRFQIASHMLWASWAIAKSGSCDIAFGYIEYAEARLTLFYSEAESF